jgi:hypothetical protein
VASGLHHGELLCSRVSLVRGLFSRVFYSLAGELI